MPSLWVNELHSYLQSYGTPFGKEIIWRGFHRWYTSPCSTILWTAFLIFLHRIPTVTQKPQFPVYFPFIPFNSDRAAPLENERERRHGSPAVHCDLKVIHCASLSPCERSTLFRGGKWWISKANEFILSLLPALYAATVPCCEREKPNLHLLQPTWPSKRLSVAVFSFCS